MSAERSGAGLSAVDICLIVLIGSAVLATIVNHFGQVYSRISALEAQVQTLIQPQSQKSRNEN
jgi:hypothetical protein